MDEQLPAVTVKDLHKHFVLPQNKHSSLKQAFVGIGRPNVKTNQKVLDGISFEIKRGEFFGIVGRNGSGKSTLLKILAGVYFPTAGKVDINGVLTPFIELGVGFNPELSGRDNVFLNGALLGFSRKAMAAMYDEIVEFAELRPFMDQKLKNYSSGMQVRLAFSIAIKAHNDILIFDEVLAVGDEAFQRKCLDVFERYRASKQTVILVTHEMETVRRFCTRAMLIDKGKLAIIGDPKAVAAQYSKLNQESTDQETINRNRQTVERRIEVVTNNGSGKKQSSFAIGAQIDADLVWGNLPGLTHLVVNIYRQSGEHVTGLRYTVDDPNQTQVHLSMTPNIKTGRYYFMVQAFAGDHALVDGEQGPEFTVTSQYVAGMEIWSGLVWVAHTWRKSNETK